MTKKVISNVQEFLTIVEEDRIYEIVNVGLLLRRHPPQAVIAFLQQLRSDYKKELSKLIKDSKTSSRVNELVVMNFRIKMAINTIKNAKEVKDAA